MLRIGHIDFIAYAVYGEVLHNTSLVDVADTRLSRSHLLPRSRSPFFLPPPLPRHPNAPDTRDTGTGSVPASLCVSDPGTGSVPAGRETSRPGKGSILPVPVGVVVQEIYFPF